MGGDGDGVVDDIAMDDMATLCKGGNETVDVMDGEGGGGGPEYRYCIRTCFVVCYRFVSS